MAVDDEFLRRLARLLGVLIPSWKTVGGWVGGWVGKEIASLLLVVA